MAQGGLKKKTFSKFVLHSKSKHPKASSKPPRSRKAGRVFRPHLMLYHIWIAGGYIAPKKASLVKANKLKKVCYSTILDVLFITVIPRAWRRLLDKRLSKK